MIGKQVVRNVKEGTKTMQKKGSLVVKDIKSRIPNEVPLRNKHTFKVEQDDEIHSAPSSPTTSNGKGILSGNLVRNNTEMNLKA